MKRKRNVLKIKNRKKQQKCERVCENLNFEYLNSIIDRSPINYRALVIMTSLCSARSVMLPLSQMFVTFRQSGEYFMRRRERERKKIENKTGSFGIAGEVSFYEYLLFRPVNFYIFFFLNL